MKFIIIMICSAAIFLLIVSSVGYAAGFIGVYSPSTNLAVGAYIGVIGGFFGLIVAAKNT